MLARLFILSTVLFGTTGFSAATGIRCVGILQFKPGTKQLAVLYSDGTLDKAFISGTDTRYSDGVLIMHKREREEMFELALTVYNYSAVAESKRINYDQMLLSASDKNRVIVFIESDSGETKRFERTLDKPFESRDVKKLEAFVAPLLEKNGRNPTTRWTGAAGACFASSLVRRR